MNGAPKPGYSSGVALAAMERISAATLPPGYSFEWTGTALQEKAASGQTAIVLELAVLFAYLFLVVPGGETLPVVLLNYIRFDLDGAIAAASTVSIILALCAVLLLEWVIGLRAYVRL